MKEYQTAIEHILANGVVKEDRTGTGTISTFGYQMRFDLSKGFPAVTTKKLAWKAVVAELLWFLEGSTDERRLAEIQFGTRNPSKTTIWAANANAWPKSKYKGDVGRIYGAQWRTWSTNNKKCISSSELITIDQIQNVIESIKTDPNSRRHIVTAWNPNELDEMALMPCHVLFQFNVTNGKLSCSLYQRSADFPLGIPFNIASYALLTHMIAQITNLQVGDLIITTGDSHIYLNQIDGVREQLNRDPLQLAKLWLNPEIKNIDDFKMDDIKLINYQSHPFIQFPFST